MRRPVESQRATRHARRHTVLDSPAGDGREQREFVFRLDRLVSLDTLAVAEEVDVVGQLAVLQHAVGERGPVGHQRVQRVADRLGIARHAEFVRAGDLREIGEQLPAHTPRCVSRRLQRSVVARSGDQIGSVTASVGAKPVGASGVDMDGDAELRPPETERDPVTEELHGEEITDPYRWLEDSDSEAVQAWTDEQNAYADRVLDTPQRDRLEPIYEEVARVTDYGAVHPAGGRYFQQIAGPEEEQPVLYVFDSLDDLRAGEGRVLVDPNEVDESGITSVDWFVPGPNGRTLAYGIAEGGDEQYDVVVIDTDDGHEVDRLTEVGRTSGEGFGWVAASTDEHDETSDDETSDDGGSDGDADPARPRGFYYVATGGADDGTQLQKSVRYHALDGETDRVVTDEFEPQEWPRVVTDGETLVVATLDGWERSDVSIADGDPATVELDPVVEGHDALFRPSLSDGRLYLLTDHEAPFRRVLAADVADLLPGESDPLAPFREVVSEDESVIQNIAPAGDRLYVHAHRDARSEVTVHEPSDAGDPEQVDLPAFASASEPAGSDDGALFLGVQTFAEPSSIRRVGPDGTVETLARQTTAPEFEIEAGQEWFESADGTEIPAFVVHREGVEPDGTNPALITGYGGFQVNRTPSFDRFRSAFLRAGGVYVLATLRGGSEYGAEWHEAGRRERKQHVFDDAIAVSEGVIERGWAASDRLAVTGGSNGGLLVGALVTQRPDLYRAAGCHVPLLDMLRFHEFLLGESWTSEYGSPDDPEAFAYLRDYSPYHNAPETAYPATLFTTALGDTRVHPAHARKMTARVQRRNTGSHPIVLRVDDDSGHGLGKPTSKIVRERAERWGFYANELGIDPDALVSDE